MKLNKKVLAVTAILAVGVLAGCGSEDMPELSLDSITAPVAARNEMEVRTALGNYTGISEAAPDSADGEMATVQFAGDASATTALHDGYIYVLSNSELRILRAQNGFVGEKARRSSIRWIFHRERPRRIPMNSPTPCSWRATGLPL